MQHSDYSMPSRQQRPNSSQQQQQQQHERVRQQQQQQQQQQTQHQGQQRHQQQQLQQHQVQPQQQMAMPLNSYYASNYPAGGLATSTAGSEHQTSPVAFNWPPYPPSQAVGTNDGTTALSFSPGTYFDGNQADAEIDAILSNYQPGMYGNLATMAQPAQQPAPTNKGNGAMSDATSEHLDQATAAAAAAAYGHLGYGGVGGVGDLNTLARGNDIANWNAVQTQSGTSSLNSAGLDFTKTLNGKGLSGGYDGDASNTSSGQTPGTISSGDDSNNGKRRRMTVGGSKSALAQQERFEAGKSTGGHDGRGASSAKPVSGRPTMQHHNTSTVNSKMLEQLAQESLQKASMDNSRLSSGGANVKKTQHERPPYRHRRSNSGSQLPTGSSTSTNTLKSIEIGGGMARRLPDPDPPPNSANNYLSSSSSLAGHAASHPPGLGSQVLRGGEGGTSGLSAASDFTKRKGWPTRIVEELLDFVHVLDRQGRVLYASPSILTLTGWRADELKGKDLSDFIHPDDVPAVKKEFQRTLQDRSQLTMYYRFQRKPQTAADKQRVRDQREAQHVSRSRSGSTSGGDSSSNQDVVANNYSTFASGSMDNNQASNRNAPIDDESERDDSRDKYVIFEATGHPYFTPQGSLPSEALNEENLEKIVPEVLSRRTPADGGGSAGLTGNPTVLDKGGGNSNPDSDEVECFFCSCRIFPTKNVGMLDSFLELKLENERLRMMLSELNVSEKPSGNDDGGSEGRRSIDESHLGYHLDYLHEMNQSNADRRNSSTGTYSDGMATHAPPSRKDSTMTISAEGGQRSMPTSPDQSLMGRTGTGGGAGQGEESDEGASPGATTSAIEEKRRKKKTKPEEGDYVCTDCGRVDSPEWRKGPLGPKTLCNACGLRWAKKVKRNGGDPNAIAMAARPAKGQIKAQAAAARAQKQNLQFQKDNGDLTQTGPPPLNSSASVSTPSHLYPSEQAPSTFGSSGLPPSFQDAYGESAMNQVGNQHDFLHSSIEYDPNNVRPHGQPDYGHMH